jgi:hypothetical protein
MIESNNIWSIPSNSNPLNNDLNNSSGHRNLSFAITISFPSGKVELTLQSVVVAAF